MVFYMYKSISVVFSLFLMGCQSTYKPLNDFSGYVVIPHNDAYYIEYHDLDEHFAQQSWLHTASKTCPKGYEILPRKELDNGSEFIPEGTMMRSPYTNLKVLLGKIKCNNEDTPKSNLTDNAWSKSDYVGTDSEVTDYFSDAYVGMQIGLKPREIRFLKTASTAKVTEFLNDKIGKSDAYSVGNGISANVWLTGEQLFDVGVVVNYEDECPTNIKVVPQNAMFSILILKEGKSEQPNEAVSARVLRSSRDMFTINSECGQGKVVHSN